MFIVFLRFTAQGYKAAQFMAGHKAWLDKGFADGLFMMSGSLPPNLGGFVLAHTTSHEVLEKIVANDPFVTEGIVAAEIVEIAPGRSDERLQFLASS